MKNARNAIKTIFFFILFTSLSIAESSIFDSDIHVVSSDETGITFTYQAPAARLSTVEGYPSKYKVPSMPRTAQDRSQDSPLLPIKVIPIGIPFNSNPTVTVINQDFSRLAEIDIPNFISELSEKKFRSRVASQIPAKNWPQQTAYIGSEDIIRGLRVVKINLAAARVENGVLYKAETITVRVDFNTSNLKNNYSPRPNGYIFENLFSDLVVNYNIARNWRIHWPPIPFKTQAVQSDFDSAQVWVKLEVAGSGIYRITRYELIAAGLDIAEVDPREIRIFYGGGAELPVNNDEPRPEFFEVPIYISGEGDGVFDGGDLLLFYAQSTDRYEYNEILQEFVYRYNHYTPKNVYWLTYDGNFAGQTKRWANIDSSPDEPGDFTVDTFTDFVHQEREIVLHEGPLGEYEDHFEWYWGQDQNFSVNVRLNDVVAGNDAHIKIKSDTNLDQLSINSETATKLSYANGITRFSSSNFNSGSSFNTLDLSEVEDFYLDYIDIYYPRWLTFENNDLRFASPDTAGMVEYHVTGVPTDYILLDITSQDNISRLINAELTGGDLTFNNLNDSKKVFYLFNSASYKVVNNYSIYEPEDLRSTSNGADYLIITPEIFIDQSLELAAHREAVSPGTRVRVVNIEDIYNQFSWGLFDPLAIRDFLKYAYENWAGAPPSYALLVGDGHYDYRNNLNSGGQMVMPPFEANFTSSLAKSYGSDESYIYFGAYGYLDYDDDNSLDMIIGRLSVNNNNQMNIVLNKIINYEASPTLGKWRNNIVVAADDHLKPGYYSETFHTRQAETLANDHVPPSMEVQKIYLVEYPVKTGNSKPDATRALINAFNEGGLIVNWIGHGNSGLWAHEYLFRRVEDMPLISNLDKLPLVFAASCSIGLFDHPSDQGMSEDFLRYEGGGAIASIGATRSVHASANAQLNNEIFDQVLYNDSSTFGEALYIAKYLRQVNSTPNTNDRKYILFGDPGLVAGKPSLKAEFTYQPDSLTGLTVDSIAGEIYNSNGEFQSNFNGTIWVLVKDASINRQKLLTNYVGNPTTDPPSYINYILPGPTIFNGPANVENGRFSSSFFVPKDITYGGSEAKIYVYFENGQIDGSGVTDTLMVAGAVAADEDLEGPTVEVYYNNQSLSEDIIAVAINSTFEVQISDPHGVNITGSMGHGIEVKIDDGDPYEADITDNFVFDMGSWQTGSASFTINNLPVGEHQLSIKAWDNYNNSTLFTTAIKVHANEEFFLDDVMNYPNPVVRSDSTVFQYLLSNDAEKISLKIFTLAGRKIRSLELYSPDYTSSGYRFFKYNLRDQDNDRLASGVYIYKIEAVGTGIDNVRRKSAIQSKLVILR